MVTNGLMISFLNIYQVRNGEIPDPYIPRISNSNDEHVIVFFNHSTYDTFTKQRFMYYGGELKIGEDWNNMFNSVSGFAGVIPTENISLFKSEFPLANVESDEETEVQMNFAAVQTTGVNSTWFQNGYKGDTGASIAVLDSGINPDQDFVNGKIVAWQNFVNSDTISDDNGHGTYISSVIGGTGTHEYNSVTPSLVRLYGNYSHLTEIGRDPASKNFSIKLFSFNISETGSQIQVNSSWTSLENGIDGFWFELLYNGSTVTRTVNLSSTQNSIMIYNAPEAGPNLYELQLTYHRVTNTFPIFTFSSNISFLPESYITNFNHFTGIANESKLVIYKVVNKSGIGYTSDLISAFASAIQNRTSYKIVSMCLAIQTLGSNTTVFDFAVNDVIDSGILVVIAAGNSGITGTQNTLNSLGTNNNALVVGATNDKDQITSYSSWGFNLDLVAPGGSKIPSHRTVISADVKSNDTTSSYGTSISTAIAAATINLLVEAQWGDWNAWDNQDVSKWTKILKARLLLTASETNLEREDDPNTIDIDESQYSPSSFNGTLGSLKDEHEGYGRLNIQAAIDSLTKNIEVNKTTTSHLVSSEVDPLGPHVYARGINLQANTQYLFNLTDREDDLDLDLFLFSNESTINGEPLLLQSSRKSYGNFTSFYFTPKSNQTSCVIVVKALEGSGNFTLKISYIENLYPPRLEIPEINFTGGSKNTTVIGMQEYLGGSPAKNYTIDNYLFFIDYFDNDSTNVPPQEVFLHIVEYSQNYSMAQFIQWENNYTAGVTFLSYLIEFTEPGVYHYYFGASDGDFKTLFPTIGVFNITIDFPTDSEQIPYNQSFNEGWRNWTHSDVGWELLTQSNELDNRTRIYENDWSSLYFGRDHEYPLNYTYQPKIITDPFPNGTLTSPLFNLTCLNENETQPFAKVGLRVSINSGDAIYFQINLNWTGWITLRTYSNIERDWFLEEVNLTEYLDNFVQFRFVSDLDDNYDSLNYKGVMVDYFAIENYTNYYMPRISFSLSNDITSFQETIFNKYLFTCQYLDDDGNYPDFIYLETDSVNYSMINIFGDWSAFSSEIDNPGIIFQKSVVLGDLENQSFRFHFSDGKYVNYSQWFNQDNDYFNFSAPRPIGFNLEQDNKKIGYQFLNNSIEEFFVTGEPLQKELTSWLQGDNTWHPISRVGRNYFLGGMGKSFGGSDQGYGQDWNSNLITIPINLTGEYDTFLQFYHEISLENEFFIEEDLDACQIFISTDNGDSWSLLKEYFYDSEDLSGNQSIEISQYTGEIIMIKFTLFSNNLTVGSGSGWLLSDIYIGYEKSTDFIAPILTFITPIDGVAVRSTIRVRVNIFDNRELDTSKILLYINNQLIHFNDYSFNTETGILEYNWDTLLQSDGGAEILVIAYDMEGNVGEKSIRVVVENLLFNIQAWVPWIIFISIVICVGSILIFYAEKRGKVKRLKMSNIYAEKVRQGYINKEQIIKRIDLIESEDELSRPLTLHCKFCGSWFESEKADYLCPVCEHDQIFVAYNCMNCGKWYFKDEPRDDYFCKNKSCVGVRLARRELNEVIEILGKDGIYLRKFEYKEKKFSILD